MMTILTEHLMLVPLTPAFLESTAVYAVGGEHIDMMVYFPKDSKEELAAYLQEAAAEFAKKRPAYLDFAVLCDGVHIGQVTMYFEGQENSPYGELGWIIRREYRGHGYAVEAAEGLMQYFYRHGGLHRFIAECDSENDASRRVIQKLGMTYIETHGGRKNRSSEEERLEELYERYFP